MAVASSRPPRQALQQAVGARDLRADPPWAPREKPLRDSEQFPEVEKETTCGFGSSCSDSEGGCSGCKPSAAARREEFRRRAVARRNQALVSVGTLQRRQPPRVEEGTRQSSMARNRALAARRRALVGLQAIREESRRDASLIAPSDVVGDNDPVVERRQESWAWYQWDVLARLRANGASSQASTTRESDYSFVPSSASVCTPGPRFSTRLSKRGTLTIVVQYARGFGGQDFGPHWLAGDTDKFAVGCTIGDRRRFVYPPDGVVVDDDWTQDNTLEFRVSPRDSEAWVEAVVLRSGSPEHLGGFWVELTKFRDSRWHPVTETLRVLDGVSGQLVPVPGEIKVYARMLPPGREPPEGFLGAASPEGSEEHDVWGGPPEEYEERLQVRTAEANTFLQQSGLIVEKPVALLRAARAKMVARRPRPRKIVQRQVAADSTGLPDGAEDSSQAQRAA